MVHSQKQFNKITLFFRLEINRNFSNPCNPCSSKTRYILSIKISYHFAGQVINSVVPAEWLQCLCSAVISSCEATHSVWTQQFLLDSLCAGHIYGRALITWPCLPQLHFHGASVEGLHRFLPPSMLPDDPQFKGTGPALPNEVRFWRFQFRVVDLYWLLRVEFYVLGQLQTSIQSALLLVDKTNFICFKNQVYSVVRRQYSIISLKRTTNQRLVAIDVHE